MKTIHGHTIDFHALLRGDPIDFFDIRDIAHALSHENRFGGYTTEPVSVAGHSIRVYERVKWLHKNTRCEDPAGRVLRAALLHDASEAYLKDIPYDLKQVLPRYRDLEDRCQEALAKHYDFHIHHPLVKQADQEMLLVEWRRHRRDDPPPRLYRLEEEDPRLRRVFYPEPYKPFFARRDFLEIALELGVKEPS